MTTEAQAIGRAAIIRAGFNSVERRLLEAVDLATEAGCSDIAERLSAALALVGDGHLVANEAAAMIAAHYGRNDVSVFSGGDADDKDQPPVQP